MISGAGTALDWIPEPMFRDNAANPLILEISLDGGNNWPPMTMERVHPDHRLHSRWQHTVDGTKHSDRAWHHSDAPQVLLTAITVKHYLVTCVATISQDANPGYGDMAAAVQFENAINASDRTWNVGSMMSHNTRFLDYRFAGVWQQPSDWGTKVLPRLMVKGASASSKNVYISNEYWTMTQLD